MSSSTSQTAQVFIRGSNYCFLWRVRKDFRKEKGFELVLQDSEAKRVSRRKHSRWGNERNKGQGGKVVLSREVKKEIPHMTTSHVSFRCYGSLLWRSVAQVGRRPEWVGGGNLWDKVKKPSRDHLTSSCSSAAYFGELFLAISRLCDPGPRRVSRGTKASVSQCLEKWPLPLFHCWSSRHRLCL